MRRSTTSRTAALAIGALLLAACGSQTRDSESSPSTEPAATTSVATTTTTTPATTTTLAATTTSSTSTTTTSTTTTIPQTRAESSVLAQALTPTEGYSYYDFDPEYVSFIIDDINASPKAPETFSSMSLHLVTHKQHLISVVQLYALRDATSEPDMSTLAEMVLTLHGQLLVGSESSSLTAGNLTAIRQSGDGYNVWLWVNEGVLYTVWDVTFDGNDSFTSDFVAAAMSAQQGLPAPAPTTVKVPSTKYIGPEDEALIAKMPVLEDYFYMDVPYETAVNFYQSFKGRTDVERGSIHFLIHGGDVAVSDDASLMGMLILVELKDPLKQNTKSVNALVKTMLSWMAAEEDTYATTQLKVGDTTVWVVDHWDESGDSTAFVWGYQGTVFVFDSSGDCWEDSCTEAVIGYINALVTANTGI